MPFKLIKLIPVDHDCISYPCDGSRTAFNAAWCIHSGVAACINRFNVRARHVAVCKFKLLLPGRRQIVPQVQKSVCQRSSSRYLSLSITNNSAPRIETPSKRDSHRASRFLPVLNVPQNKRAQRIALLHIRATDVAGQRPKLSIWKHCL